MTLTDRLRYVEDSPTLALAAKAKALLKEGKPVLNFTAGETDFSTPDHAKLAGVQAIEENDTRYTPVAGIPELRAATAQSINRTRGTDYSPAQTLITCGAKHALYNIFQALCQPGDEVIVLSPYWVSFPPIVHLSGAKPVIVDTTEQDQFLPDPDAIRRAVTSATKAMIINSPSNPTGAVIDEVRLRAIAQLAKERDLIIVSDEIYDQLVYPPARHRSIVQVDPGIIDRTIIVGGVSKTYSMTGWRIGYALGPQPWIQAMMKLQSHSTSNPASISQRAALAALTGDQGQVGEMLQKFQQRRDQLVNGLNRLAPLRCAVPGGAFYAWCNVSGVGQSADATAKQWLEELFVATVPGEGFGCPGYIRLSYATSLTVIDEALERIEAWLKKRSG